MRWRKMGMGFKYNPLGSYRQVVGACLFVSGVLLLTQVLPKWVGTLFFGTALIVSGVLLFRR